MARPRRGGTIVGLGYAGNGPMSYPRSFHARNAPIWPATDWDFGQCLRPVRSTIGARPAWRRKGGVRHFLEDGRSGRNAAPPPGQGWHRPPVAQRTNRRGARAVPRWERTLDLNQGEIDKGGTGRGQNRAPASGKPVDGLWMIRDGRRDGVGWGGVAGARRSLRGSKIGFKS
jgi:hypothetical protein